MIVCWTYLIAKLLMWLIIWRVRFAWSHSRIDRIPGNISRAVGWFVIVELNWGISWSQIQIRDACNEVICDHFWWKNKGLVAIQITSRWRKSVCVNVKRVISYCFLAIETNNRNTQISNRVPVLCLSDKQKISSII